MRELTILQMNDTHGYLEPHPELFWEATEMQYMPDIGRYARLAAMVRQAREAKPEGVLLLDNGDTLHGTFPAVQTKGEALIPLLKSLGPAAMTAHWEFAYGPEIFKQCAEELPYPVLALNVKKKDNGENFFPPYQVVESGGLRVGVVGIASNIVDKTMPPSFSQGLAFDLGKNELPTVIDQLRSQEKVDLIVLLSHLGFPQDVQLLSDVPGIDICLSGHTHNRLYRPAQVGGTILIQSGSQGSFLGYLDLFVENRKVVDYRHRLAALTPDILPDPEMESLVKQALAPFREELEQVVGETASPLDRGLNLETTMDDLLLHAIQDLTGSQLAFSNGWRYGAPILPGLITLNDLYNIIPMDPPVSTVEITGEELTEMIEENLEHTYSRDPYHQVGGYLKRGLGLKVYFKVENPYGQRIHRLFVGHEEVKAGQTYTAAFVTEQGVPKKYGRNRQQHAEHAIDALRMYLAEHRPLKVELQNTFVLI